jgi:hypothetical protein
MVIKCELKKFLLPPNDTFVTPNCFEHQKFETRQALAFVITHRSVKISLHSMIRIMYSMHNTCM